MNPFQIDCLTPFLKGKKIALCITGSIAAFKSHDIIRFLKECQAEVKVILSKNAKQFVTPLTLETLSGQKVFTDLFEDAHGTHHIDCARWADVFLIAPATANCIAKLANGLADDLISTELLAFQGPLFVAPAMNPDMYSHPATQKNIETLSSRGVTFIGPTQGKTACAEIGLGRMSEPNEILENIAVFNKSKRNKKILISFGPTQSNLDPVRYITNRSSGKMGVALCYAAQSLGYTVIAVSGPTQLQSPSFIKNVKVKTTTEMHEAVTKLFPTCDIFISAAAVLDFEFTETQIQKVKKDKSESLPFNLKPTTDILSEVSKIKKPHQTIIGFAAETDSHIENAKSKLANKKLDAVFVNPIEDSQFGFESQNNKGFFITPTQVETLESNSKINIALQIINKLEKVSFTQNENHFDH